MLSAPNSNLPEKSIFMCYRRLDSEDVVDRIYDSFQTEFSKEALFRDIDTIPPGVDFPSYVLSAIQSCQVVLVFIGRDWLGATAGGTRRLEDPEDHVRVEVETALGIEGMRVIPVLVRRAEMPGPADLPNSLGHLAFRNAITVRSGVDYQNDVSRLIHHVRAATEEWAAEAKRKLADARKARIAEHSQVAAEVDENWDPQLAPGTVFISHAREDRAFGRRMARALEGAGLSVWCNRYLEFKVPKEVQAKKAIEQCALFLPLVSRNTESRFEGFFRSEWNFALNENVRKASRYPFIVPILLHHLQASELHLIPPDFRDLAMTSCPNGVPDTAFTGWAAQAVASASTIHE